MTDHNSSNIKRFINRRCSALGIASVGNFELTPRCNLRCKMCYVRLTPEQMSGVGREFTAEQWLSLAREAVSAGMLFLLITGGEPTLRSDFSQIYEGLAQMGLSISINTNGTLITPSLRELWHKFPPAQVNITLYGVCREDYAQLCGDPNAFDAVMDAIRWLKEEGILVFLNTTMVPSNQHRFLDIEEFARDHQLDLRMTTYCFPPSRRKEGCAACDDFSRLSPEHAAELSIQDLYFREGADAVIRRAEKLKKPLPDDVLAEEGESMHCLAAKSLFWVTWDGRMTPCGMLSEPTVYPLRDGFSASWQALKEKSASIRLCAQCASCPERSICLNCAAVTHTETGSFSGKPEYMCRLSKSYREKILLLSDQLIKRDTK